MKMTFKEPFTYAHDGFRMVTYGPGEVEVNEDAEAVAAHAREQGKLAEPARAKTAAKAKTAAPENKKA